VMAWVVATGVFHADCGKEEWLTLEIRV